MWFRAVLFSPDPQWSPWREGQNCCIATHCNVHPHFKHYKVLTGSCSEHNILPGSGFPPCSSRFLHGNNCKWRAPLSPRALDSNCITLTHTCSSDRTHLIAVDHVITRLLHNTHQPHFCNNHLSLWVSAQYLNQTAGHFEVRHTAPHFRKTKPGRGPLHQLLFHYSASTIQIFTPKAHCSCLCQCFSNSPKQPHRNQTIKTIKASSHKNEKYP